MSSVVAKTSINSVTPNDVAGNIANLGGSYVTPPQIATAYNIPANTGYGVKVGIVSCGGGFLQSDLNLSLGNLGLSQYGTTITQVLLNGASGTFSTSDNNASLENTLDVYCVASMVPRANIVIYISTVNTTTDWNNAFARAVSDGCDVITHSWGTDEAYGYGDFLSSSLSSAIAQGTTVLCSSGDYGSEGSSAAGVLTTDYPATNADVVAVGGTVLTLNSDNTRNTEVYDVDSGGGLSTVVAIPSFQQINTLHYTPIVGGVTGSPNVLNVRGVPDVSAPFMTYPLYYNGAIVDVGGTSASTPVMAGMVARFKALTGQRLGLANNLFYSNPNAFYEITSGNDLAEMNNGYAATAGWNAVTGLGAPIGSALYQLLKTAAFSTYPQRTYGYRPSAGPVYPRRTNGIR